MGRRPRNDEVAILLWVPTPVRRALRLAAAATDTTMNAIAVSALEVKLRSTGWLDEEAEGQRRTGEQL